MPIVFSVYHITDKLLTLLKINIDNNNITSNKLE